MISNRHFIGATLALAAVGLGIAATAHAQTPPAPTPPAAAASPCLNVDEAKCPTVAGCVWLPGFKIKGAPDVAGYCRTAPTPLTARRPGDPAPKQ